MGKRSYSTVDARKASFQPQVVRGETIEWPGVIAADIMAANGFYFDPSYQYRDSVTCYCCRKKEHGWQSEQIAMDDGICESPPAVRHLVSSPDCANARVLAARFESMHSRNFNWDHDDLFRDPLASTADRIKTFAGWPHNMKLRTRKDGCPTAQELAENGFFYLGSDDATMCLYCGLKLEGWDEGDNVADEHRRECPDCYVFHSKEGSSDGTTTSSAYRLANLVSKPTDQDQPDVSAHEDVPDVDAPMEDEVQPRPSLNFPVDKHGIAYETIQNEGYLDEPNVIKQTAGDVEIPASSLNELSDFYIEPNDGPSTYFNSSRTGSRRASRVREVKANRIDVMPSQVEAEPPAPAEPPVPAEEVEPYVEDFEPASYGPPDSPREPAPVARSLSPAEIGDSQSAIDDNAIGNDLMMVVRKTRLPAEHQRDLVEAIKEEVKQEVLKQMVAIRENSVEPKKHKKHRKRKREEKERKKEEKRKRRETRRRTRLKKEMEAMVKEVAMETVEEMKAIEPASEGLVEVKKEPVELMEPMEPEKEAVSEPEVEVEIPEKEIPRTEPTVKVEIEETVAMEETVAPEETVAAEDIEVKKEVEDTLSPTKPLQPMDQSTSSEKENEPPTKDIKVSPIAHESSILSSSPSITHLKHKKLVSRREFAKVPSDDPLAFVGRKRQKVAPRRQEDSDDDILLDNVLSQDYEATVEDNPEQAPDESEADDEETQEESPTQVAPVSPLRLDRGEADRLSMIGVKEASQERGEESDNAENSDASPSTFAIAAAQQSTPYTEKQPIKQQDSENLQSFHQQLKETTESTVETSKYSASETARTSWDPIELDPREHCKDLEEAADCLKELINSKYRVLSEDLDGGLTSFIAEMPPEELEMSIKEWLEYRAAQAAVVVREKAARIKAEFQSNAARALSQLESMQVND